MHAIDAPHLGCRRQGLHPLHGHVLCPAVWPGREALPRGPLVHKMCFEVVAPAEFPSLCVLPGVAAGVAEAPGCPRLRWRFLFLLPVGMLDPLRSLSTVHCNSTVIPGKDDVSMIILQNRGQLLSHVLLHDTDFGTAKLKSICLSRNHNEFERAPPPELLQLAGPAETAGQDGQDPSCRIRGCFCQHFTCQSFQLSGNFSCAAAYI